MHHHEGDALSSPTALKIIESASGLFMQRGYRAVSITDIIKAAEVTKPTLYYYFPDKEEVFVQVGLHALAELEQRLHSAIGQTGDVRTRLLALANALLNVREGDMRMMRREMSEHMSPASQARLGKAFYAKLFTPIFRVMQEGITSGELGRFPAPTLTMMFLGMSEALHEFSPNTAQVGWDTTRPPDFQIEVSAQHLVDMFLYGVATPTPATLIGAN